MLKQNKGKILALDIGRKKTGLALTDFDQVIVFSRPEIFHLSEEDLLVQLGEFLNNEKVCKIIIGLPLGLKGNSTEQTEFTKKLSEKIKNKFKIDVKMIDERFSSQEASKLLKKEKIIDSMVAKILLENYLSKA